MIVPAAANQTEMNMAVSWHNLNTRKVTELLSLN